MEKMDLNIETDETICFCWDRDATVNIGQWPGPIPLEWVQYLQEETHHQVWATGNQRLKSEARLKGTEELLDSIPGHEAVLHRNPGRRERLRLVQRVVDADVYVVIDDVDLTDMEEEGFIYYTPEGFIEAPSPFLSEVKDAENPDIHPVDRYNSK